MSRSARPDLTSRLVPCLIVGLGLLISSTAGAQDFGVDMPAEPAPGVVFPTAETVINGWVFANPPNDDEIYRHGWGLWAGLTAKTGTEAFGIENALVYQTWWSPGEILAAMNGEARRPSIRIRTPRQFARGNGTSSILATSDTCTYGPNCTTGFAIDTDLTIDCAVAETVAYSPPSSRHTFINELLWTDTLDQLVDDGYTELPAFPVDGVNVKPVYKVIQPDELNDGHLYAMPAWPGTPDVSNWTQAQQERGFPNCIWKQCVYIDVGEEGGTDARGVDPTCADPSPENTYGLGDFIHVRITAEDQAHFESLVGSKKSPLEVGDVLILVGMHVTSRETERWTWQTFWWSADPDAPNAPSSEAIADARPTTLSGPAAHYAMATAYSMLVPAQPLVGGKNVGSLLPAYNPHLEAGFGSGTFGKTVPVETPSGTVTTNLGVQSNCMSCHGMAAYEAKGSTYVSDYYVPRDDPAFAGGMTADFAWSIVDEAKPKPTTKTSRSGSHD